MRAYGIDWSRLVDRALVADIAGAVQLAPIPDLEEVQAILVRTLRATGGWPYVTKRPSAAQARAHARWLLGEAFAHAAAGGRAAMPGYRLREAGRGMWSVEAVGRTEINVGGHAELTLLPGITSRLAQSIIDERAQRGPFRSMKDLVERIPGFGRKRAAALAGSVAFHVEPGARASTGGDWMSDLVNLVAREPGQDGKARLVAALERVALAASADRHPHLRHHLPREIGRGLRPRGDVAEHAIVLAGRRYYDHIQDAVRRAEARIDVLMFHIALPRENHPTRRLLEALVRAQRRGVRVRVLVDRDRRNDPYRSHVINAAAVRHLLGHGIRVRVDRPARLLHSKMVVIDEDTTIIGSHNWSAGSYFAFDDLSVAVRSVGFARRARKRFETLWRRGEAARRGRGTARP
jgi:hypothetical protein